MSMIEIYRGDSKRIDLTFVTDSGTPLNLSGYWVYFGAKQSYSDTGTLFTVIQTGHDLPVSGFTHIDLTSGNTTQCVGDYLAEFKLYLTGSSGPSTFQTDGLRILPAFSL